MPLHDHFRPTMSETMPADSLHMAWAGEINRRLNAQWLQDPFRARQHTRSGSALEIDVATQERRAEIALHQGNGSAVTTLPATWAPPIALVSAPLEFPDVIEVRVFEGPGSWYLVGAIELLSRTNKNTPARREAFVAKCATYLRAGVSVVLVDIVTDRHANLHNSLLAALDIDGGQLPPESYLYASAYRPVQREGNDEVDVWAEVCVLGLALPTMPLRLTGDTFVPVELELTYMEALRANNVVE